MATVTSFKASKVQEILDSTIVDGSIVDNELILELHDGSELNLGTVLGVPGGGVTGAVYAKNSDDEQDADWTTTPSLDSVTLNSDDESVSIAAIDADPEGVETATPGSLRLVSNGNLWKKLSGSGNTGWVKVFSASDMLLGFNRRTADYTLISSDANKVIEFNSFTSMTLTIPDNATVPFPIGTKIEGVQFDSGPVTITGAGGVTVNSLGDLYDTSGQWARFTLIKRATDSWYLSGDLV